MSEIPEDVMDVMRRYVRPEFLTAATLEVERAILAERERCVKIAKELPPPETS